MQAVALAPTRELAIQVAEELAQLGKAKGVRIETIYGGDSMDRQLEGSAPAPTSSWARPAASSTTCGARP